MLAAARLLPVLAAVALLLGPTPSRGAGARERGFDFARDVFDFANELVWIYEAAPDGDLATRPRPGALNTHRCTAMARGARLFFEHARFEPEAEPLGESGYLERVERLMEIDPRERGRVEPVAIPGYANLRDFSRAHPRVVLAGLGGAWRSYLQRGNWRMVFPFAPRQLRATAKELVEDLERGELPIVRLVIFPDRRINHTVLLFGVESDPVRIRFHVYDPNDSLVPTELVFDRASAGFSFPVRDYFAGGEVDVYEVYDGLLF